MTRPLTPFLSTAVTITILGVSVQGFGDISLDEAWARREHLTGLERIVSLYEAASRRIGARPLVFERLVRARYQMASDWMRDGSEGQIEEFRRAVDDGIRGLSAAGNGPVTLHLRDIQQVDEQKELIRKTAVGILYWTALAYSRIISTLALHRQAGAARRFLRLLERLVDLDGSYFLGGPHRVIAEYLHKAPSIMGGDDARARRHADRAVEIASTFAPNLVCRAENVWHLAWDSDRRRSDLEAAMRAADERYPQAVPEQRAAKKRARELLH